MPVQHVKKVAQKVMLCTLSTRQHHNFFVSDRDLLAHNFVIELGAIAGCKALFSITSTLLTCAVVWIGSKMIGRGRGHAFIIPPPSNNDWHHYLKKESHGFQGKDPKKIWNFALNILMAAIDRDELRDGA